MSFSVLWDKMSPSTKLDEKLEGIEKLRAWKYRIGLILEENDIVNFIKEVLQSPKKMKQRKSTRNT